MSDSNPNSILEDIKSGKLPLEKDIDYIISSNKLSNRILVLMTEYLISKGFNLKEVLDVILFLDNQIENGKINSDNLLKFIENPDTILENIT